MPGCRDVGKTETTIGLIFIAINLLNNKSHVKYILTYTKINLYYKAKGHGNNDKNKAIQPIFKSGTNGPGRLCETDGVQPNSTPGINSK
jgi:hypothetical protein